MRSTTTGLMIASLVLATATASAADYGVKGSVATTTTNLPAGFGGATGGKVVVPTAAGTYPLIVASHGFSAGAENQVGWAEQFASYGFVVVAPAFPGGFSPDHAKNGEIIKTIVATIDTAETAAKGKVDKTRVGLEGHSAGGLATTLAAADVKPLATVLFDPADNGTLGKTAYAKLCAPVLSLFAAPSMCNNNTGWFDFRTTALGPTTSFRVKGSTHCDGENAPRSLCGFTCGGAAEPTRQKTYARYATAFFVANIKGDADAAAQLAMGALAADTALGEVSVGGGPSCTTTSPGDAGPTDASTPTDSGTSDSGLPPADSGAAGTDSGPIGTADAGERDADLGGQESIVDESGCSCATPHPTRTTPLLAPLALAALLLRRRR